jgi:hypothetical protein
MPDWPLLEPGRSLVVVVATLCLRVAREDSVLPFMSLVTVRLSGLKVVVVSGLPSPAPIGLCPVLLGDLKGSLSDSEIGKSGWWNYAPTNPL